MMVFEKEIYVWQHVVDKLRGVQKGWFLRIGFGEKKKLIIDISWYMKYRVPKELSGSVILV